MESEWQGVVVNSGESRLTRVCVAADSRHNSARLQQQVGLTMGILSMTDIIVIRTYNLRSIHHVRHRSGILLEAVVHGGLRAVPSQQILRSYVLRLCAGTILAYLYGRGTDMEM